MRTKMLHKAKLIIKVNSNRKTRIIETESVFDNRTKSYWSHKQIAERGIIRFLNEEDLKETLNWNLNGNSSKYQFKWAQTGKSFSEGYAYVFE